MSIDMTGLARLSQTGKDRLFSELPDGKAKKDIQFAFKAKKVIWGKQSYKKKDGGSYTKERYHADVVVRTLDMQVVLGDYLWKMYPNMLPEDIIEAFDCDDYDDTWWLVRTVENENSRAEPKHTMLHLIDIQQGLDASGPPKPAAAGASETTHQVHPNSSERGQPRAGGTQVQPIVSEEEAKSGIISAETVAAVQAASEPPAACPHPYTAIRLIPAEESKTGEEGFYCSDCGEGVG